LAAATCLPQQQGVWETVTGNSISGTSHGPVSRPRVSWSDTNQTVSSFLASWTNVPGVISYRLDVSKSNSFGTFLVGYHDLPVNGTSENVTGLTANTFYHYRVRSYNGNSSRKRHQSKD
jgi:hypothetical protein